jgi:hypothetical protein
MVGITTCADSVHAVTYGWRRVDGAVAEVCDECGFDSRKVIDVMSDLRSVILAMQVLAGDGNAGRRPGAGIWSASEYVDHTISVVAECCEEVAEAAGVVVGERPSSCERALDFMQAFGFAVGSIDLDRVTIEAPFATLTATGNLHHALHDAEHHCLDIRRGYATFALASGDVLHTSEA